MSHGPGRARAALSLAIVCLGTLVAPLDTAVNIALPSITAAFGIRLEDIRWVVIAYVLTYSSLLLICGKIGDRIGYRSVFQAGLAVSAAGFAVCTLATAYEWLLVGRIGQGVGVALVLSCGPALATSLYDERHRTRVLATYAAATSIGAALGPIVGGALIDQFGWSAVFAMRFPLALIALALSWLIPPTPSRASGGRFDALGAALLIGWMVALLLALSLRDRGFELRMGLAGAALIVLAAFVVHERRHPEPIIRPSLFRDVEFTLMNVMSIAIYFAIFSVLLLVPYFLIRVRGLDAGTGGLFLALPAVGGIVGAWIAGRCAGTVGVGRIALAGVISAIAGLGGIVFWTADTSLVLVALALAVQGLGVGLFQVSYTDLVTAILPRADRGVAGSLTMVTRTIGTVAGASLHAAVQRHYSDAARAAGSGYEAAFLAGFNQAFLVASGTLAVALALSLLRPQVWLRRTT